VSGLFGAKPYKRILEVLPVARNFSADELEIRFVGASSSQVHGARAERESSRPA
jgi:hypothetical protein